MRSENRIAAGTESWEPQSDDFVAYTASQTETSVSHFDHQNNTTQSTSEYRGLNPSHVQHFVDEGWTSEEIRLAISWGVRSVGAAEATDLLGFKASSGGIWFPFSDSFGQLRIDQPSRNGPKYMSSKGEINEESRWIPPDASLETLAAVTEGWKDAFIATVRSGRPVAAIAGVSHVRKTLPEGANIPLIFDADALTNASVLGALVTGGQHLKGKIAIIPKKYGEKAGLTEFYVGGGDWPELRFQSPGDLLKEWMYWLLENPLFIPKNCEDIEALHRKVARLAKGRDGFSKLIKKEDVVEWKDQHVKAWGKAFAAQQRAQQVLSLENSPIGEFPELQLPPKGQRHLFSLNGQKGTGKTSRSIKSLVDAAKASGLSVLVYVPTRMLSRDAARVLGLTCHLDKDEAARSLYVMACGESAHLFRDRKWDIVIIDEANEVLYRSWMETLGQSPHAARKALVGQIASAGVVCIAQDGLYRPVLNGIQRIGNFSADQVEIISRRRPQGAGTVHLYSGGAGQYGWLKALLDSASGGDKLSIPCGSEEELTVLHRLLKGACPDGVHKKLTGKSKSFGGDRKAFAAGPDDWIGDIAPDTLGFSPVFNSGVSIQRSYFDIQFEYISALETASSASQRGERVRDAIGKIPRHVFIQKRGLPGIPPMEIFTVEYWKELLDEEDEQKRPNLKTLGMGDVQKLIERSSTAIDDHPELAQILVMHATEIFFKQECLVQEWEFNGWDVIAGTPASKGGMKFLSKLRRDAKEQILETKARILAAAPSQSMAEARRSSILGEFRAGQEAAGPVSASKFTRWSVEDKLGDLPLLAMKEFWESFYLDGNGAISAAQVNSLLKLQFEYPEIWAEIQRNAALRVVGSQAVRDAAATQAASSKFYEDVELPDVPDLVARPKLLQTAALLGRCPGIRKVFSGELIEWDKNSSVLKAAHRWAAAHAVELASLSKHSQRFLGYQFSEKTPIVTAFHKLLAMVGFGNQFAGLKKESGTRIRRYRIKTAEDVRAQIKKAKDEASRLLRELYREEHREEVVAAAMERSIQIHQTEVKNWVALDAFAREHFGLRSELQREEKYTTEAVISSSETPIIKASDWLDMGEMLRQAQLFCSSAVDELRETLYPLIGDENWIRLVRGLEPISA